MPSEKPTLVSPMVPSLWQGDDSSRPPAVRGDHRGARPLPHTHLRAGKEAASEVRWFVPHPICPGGFLLPWYTRVHATLTATTGAWLRATQVTNLALLVSCDPGPAHLDPGPVGAGLSTPTTAPGWRCPNTGCTIVSSSSGAFLDNPRGDPLAVQAAGLTPLVCHLLTRGTSAHNRRSRRAFAGALAGGWRWTGRCSMPPPPPGKLAVRYPGLTIAVPPPGAGRCRCSRWPTTATTCPPPVDQRRLGARRAGDGLDGLAPRRAPRWCWPTAALAMPGCWPGCSSKAWTMCSGGAAGVSLTERDGTPLVPGPRALAPGGSALASPGAVRRGSTLPAPARQRGVLLARRARPRPHSAAPAPTGCPQHPGI